MNSSPRRRSDRKSHRNSIALAPVIIIAHGTL